MVQPPRHALVSPVDLPMPADPEPHPLRWTATVIATAAALLALFNATALVGWAHDLPPGLESAKIVAVAEGWYGVTDRLGLTVPGELVRAGYDRLKAARFSGSKTH